MKKHRVAVIGCGALAQSAHLPNCQQNPRVELVATCATEAAVGTTLCTLGREEEWDGVAVGVLDTEGEKDRKWIVNPWTRGG